MQTQGFISGGSQAQRQKPLLRQIWVGCIADALLSADRRKRCWQVIWFLFRYMFPAENFGRHISETTENSIEITMVFNAYLKGYLGYVQIAFNQEVLCLVDASP